MEDPIVGLALAPDRLYHCRISFDAPAQTVTWYVDDKTVFEARVPHIPASVKIGLGIFTLHPTDGVASSSLHGQGLSALWRNVGATTAPRSGIDI